MNSILLYIQDNQSLPLNPCNLTPSKQYTSTPSFPFQPPLTLLHPSKPTNHSTLLPPPLPPPPPSTAQPRNNQSFAPYQPHIYPPTHHEPPHPLSSHNNEDDIRTKSSWSMTYFSISGCTIGRLAACKARASMRVGFVRVSMLSR